jgi:hypothetical protein
VQRYIRPPELTSCYRRFDGVVPADEGAVYHALHPISELALPRATQRSNRARAQGETGIAWGWGAPKSPAASIRQGALSLAARSCQI